MNPLETRALPGSLWERAPQWLKDGDQHLADRIKNSIDLGSSPWRQLYWLTESWQGYSLALLTLALLWLSLQKDASGRRFAGFRNFREVFKKFLVVVLLASVGNVISSNLLKVFIGRFKPHVVYYNPLVLPALSLPSSHAFNTAFVFFLVLSACDSSSRKRHRLAFWISGVLVVLIGYSRVLFGQHYPLDVTVGWLLGGALGWATSKGASYFST